MKELIIDLTKCFECENPMEEMHHVIPKSRGGKATIPLCIDCHGKAHNIENRRLYLEAAKRGRDNYVKNGGKLGRKKGSKHKDISQTKNYKEVCKMLELDYKLKDIVSIAGVSANTVRKIRDSYEI